jgi:hypothetical protein
VKLTITEIRIDVADITLFPAIEWKPILDELHAVHLPGLYQTDKRMGVNIIHGKVHAYIYRTPEMPPEPEIRAILKRHGIE